MNICPKCNREFDAISNTGYVKKYCSRKCANSRSFSTSAKNKKSIANQKRYAKLTEDEKRALKKRISDKQKENARRKMLESDFEKLGQQLKKERILFEQDYVCDICRCEPVWNGSPLNFHLDHINGDRKDNTRQNLRMICPNCHSQTETYCRSYKIADAKIEEQIINGLNNYQICQHLGINTSANSYRRLNKIRDSIN